MNTTLWLHQTAQLCMLGMVLALALSLYRLVRGPSLADRVAALDAMAITLIGLAAVFAILKNAPVWIDVGIAAVVVGFLGTTAIAQYLIRR